MQAFVDHVPTLEQWRSLDPDAAMTVAGNVARQVHADEVNLREHTYAGERMLVASFVLGGTRFSLVPGGPARLGYDAARFVPTVEELASFDGDDSALFTEGIVPEAPPSPLVADGVDYSGLRQHLAEYLTSPRTVDMPALLVATDPAEAGLTRIAVDDSAVAAHLAEHPWSPPFLSYKKDWFAGEDDPTTYVRLNFSPTGEVTDAWLSSYVTYDMVTDELAERGQRLLSPDEWEWVSGLGTRTLFPWGDRFPNRYDDTEGKFVQALPDGTVVDNSDGNLFNLRLAVNSYNPELTSVREEVRGGDFGEASCGGMPVFHHELLKAPAFRDLHCAEGERGRADVRHRLYRAVVPIDKAPQVPCSSSGSPSNTPRSSR